MKFRVEVNGEKELTLAIRKVSEASSDLRPFAKEIRQWFKDTESDQFQSEGTAGASGRWKPRSKAYEESLGTFELLAGLERRTDRLYRSLTGETSDSVFEINKDEIVMGTTVPYASPQHHGAPSRNLPARPLISPSQKQYKGLQSVLKKGLMPFIKKSGLTVDENSFGDI